MSLFLQIEMFILALMIFYFIIRMVNKNAFSIRRAAPWIFVGLTIVFISIFPQVVSFVAHKAGFELTMNFLLFGAILFVFVLELLNTSSNTQKDNQIKELIQEISLMKKEIEDNKK
ncbi:DUF2304 domain-containing protein [Streptococcus pluranimalium]|uniref:DUF2304 domain-containing protein n=1 Tax=Streptococcus pluranimalium TaxID=82348 RepID=UPI00293083A7|nr:DUF2304 domain-containing protein [Streptococcus pluranimalium]